jgi:hypothetical protein
MQKRLCAGGPSRRTISQTSGKITQVALSCKFDLGIHLHGAGFVFPRRVHGALSIRIRQGRAPAAGRICGRARCAGDQGHCRGWPALLPCHICARTGLTRATSAPGLGSPCHICNRTSTTTALGCAHAAYIQAAGSPGMVSTACRLCPSWRARDTLAPCAGLSRRSMARAIAASVVRSLSSVHPSLTAL